MIGRALRYIKHDIFEYYYYLFLNNKKAKSESRVYVCTIEETIDKVVKDKVSVSRYGDGELLWMLGKNQNSFQDPSEELSERLREIIKTDREDHIVCLSDAFQSLDAYNHFAIRFWSRFMVTYREAWIGLLKSGKTYYNTNMTRLYMDYKEKQNARHYYDKMKLIWKDRPIVLIEGEFSRLGYGNDLFDGAKSIKRILAPATNAYFAYDKILQTAQNLVTRDSVILIALGPTATVLAYDLAVGGYQALDVGHVDVEYEWMRMGATEKVAIPSKYVNEAPNGSGRNLADLKDEEYQKQIIARITV